MPLVQAASPIDLILFELITILEFLITKFSSVVSYKGADKSLAPPTSRCIFFMVRVFRLMLVL